MDLYSLLVLLVAFNFSTFSIATPLERKTDVCSSDFYGTYGPILARFPPVEAFCSAVFPLPWYVTHFAVNGTFSCNLISDTSQVQLQLSNVQLLQAPQRVQPML